jgi:energy-coupling factor transporter ATP-binding protein EcfA2
MPRRPANSAAWLASIELENVRCFRKRQVLPFTTSDGKAARWTLLLGENGCGKSTLLQVCALLMPRRWEPQADGTVEGIPQASENGSVEWLRLLPFPRPSDEAARLSLSLRTEAADLRWSWAVTPNYSGLKIERDPPSLKDPPLLPLCLAYAPYRSPWAFIPQDTSPTLTRGLFHGFTLLRHPVEWFKDRTFASVNPNSTEASRTTAAAILEKVRDILLSVLPDVSELRIDTEREGLGPNRLRAKTSFGWVNIDNLGMGYQSVLALIIDIASRLIEHYPKSPHPLDEPAIVLIDEIDLHLHPRWQRTLQQQLTDHFPNIQFIATAHSPLVVQSAPSANIVLLRREGDHVVIERAPDAVQTWRVDQLLTSDLFGLPSARPPTLDPWIQERDAILSKPELTPADEKRLEELRAQIGNLPGGESPWEMEAMELIRKSANALKTPEDAPAPTKKRSPRKPKASR